MVVVGVAAAGLMQGSLTGFFASRQCPGTAVLAATDWALQQAREHPWLIGSSSGMRARAVRWRGSVPAGRQVGFS